MCVFVCVDSFSSSSFSLFSDCVLMPLMLLLFEDLSIYVHTQSEQKKRKRFQPLLKNVRKKFRCDSTQQAEEDAAADADDADDDGKEI